MVTQRPRVLPYGGYATAKASGNSASNCTNGHESWKSYTCSLASLVWKQHASILLLTLVKTSLITPPRFKESLEIVSHCNTALRHEQACHLSQSPSLRRFFNLECLPEFSKTTLWCLGLASTRSVFQAQCSTFM